jgi:hypothetical protein
MLKLQTLKSLNDDRATVKDACFDVGWHLLSADSWAYVDIWTGKRGEVSLDALIKAVEAKKLRLNSEKPKHREKPMFTINKAR